MLTNLKCIVDGIETTVIRDGIVSHDALTFMVNLHRLAVSSINELTLDIANITKYVNSEIKELTNHNSVYVDKHNRLQWYLINVPDIDMEQILAIYKPLLDTDKRKWIIKNNGLWADEQLIDIIDEYCFTIKSLNRIDDNQYIILIDAMEFTDITNGNKTIEVLYQLTFTDNGYASQVLYRK